MNYFRINCESKILKSENKIAIIQLGQVRLREDASLLHRKRSQLHWGIVLWRYSMRANLYTKARRLQKLRLQKRHNFKKKTDRNNSKTEKKTHAIPLFQLPPVDERIFPDLTVK